MSRVTHAQKGELVSLATDADRTLFFDFLSLNTRRCRASPPASSSTPCRASRSTTLRGSSCSRAWTGSSSWSIRTGNGWPTTSSRSPTCRRNLVENHLSLVQIPYVLQYNKRDIPNAGRSTNLEFTFNNRANRALAFEAVASTGEGVLETLNACARLLLAKYSKTPTAMWPASPPPPACPGRRVDAGRRRRLTTKRL